MSRVMVMPKNGEKYGFPKELPSKPKDLGQLFDWLEEMGYPQEELGTTVSVDYWEETDDDSTRS